MSTYANCREEGALDNALAVWQEGDRERRSDACSCNKAIETVIQNWTDMKRMLSTLTPEWSTTTTAS